jgi:hypothetical protein
LAEALIRLSQNRVRGEVVTSGPADVFGLTPSYGRPPYGRELACD